MSRVRYLLVLLAAAMVCCLAGAQPVGPFAYITNSGNGTVSVLDTASNTVIDTVPVGSYPVGVAVTPDGSKVYVANMGSNSVSVINTTTNTVIHTVSVGYGPYGVAVIPDGSTIYVTDASGNAVSVINTTTNTVTATVSVGGYPVGVAVTPDGSTVFVANMDDNSVSVINTSNNTIDTELLINPYGGSGPVAVAVNPDGSTVYVTGYQSNSVSEFLIPNNYLFGNYIIVGTDPNGIAVTPDGSKVYVTNEASTSVSVISVNNFSASDHVIATIPVGHGPLGVAVTPDGSKVYVANMDDNSVSVINTSTNTVTATISGFNQPFSFGQFIGPSSHPLTIYSVRYDGNYAPVGTVPVDSSSPYSTGAIVTVLGNTGNLVMPDYYFNNWNTAADGSGMSYAPNATFTMGSAPVTLYAQWVHIPRSVPVANAGGPYVITWGDDLLLNGTGSYDPDMDWGDYITTYKWDLNDDGNFNDASGAKPSIPWNMLPVLLNPTVGHAYPIYLQVTDTTSRTGQAITSLTITYPQPVANFTGIPTSGIAPLPVTFTDTSTGSPTGWAWYFGDENYTAPWTQVNASPGWTGRQSHASVVMPDGKIVLIGGYDGNSYKEDVWLSADNGTTWTQVGGYMFWYTPRSHHTSVAMPDGSIVLMGGNGGSGGLKNDTYRSTDFGDSWWQQNTSAGWTARESHTSVVMPDGSIVLMGGFDDTKILNDTWRSTDNGTTWARMNASSGWPARYGHTSVAMPDGSIVLIGGTNAVSWMNDTWRSTDNGATWTQVNASAGWIGRSYFNSVAMPDGSIVLMGGAGEPFYYRNDVWRSKDNGTTWTQVNASAGWTKRGYLSGNAMPDGSIVVLGGYDGSYNKNDVWRFNPVGSLVQNPSHTYTMPGVYPVALQAYNTGGYNSTRKIGYITVMGSSPLVANFTANVTSGIAPLTVQFNDTSAGSPQSWNWSFGDSLLSTTQNPVHVYSVPGNYSVSLNVSNADGFNISTKTDYIRVTEPAPVSHLSVIILPDFTIPQGFNKTILVTLVNVTDASAVGFVLRFNPTIIQIEDIQVNTTLPGANLEYLINNTLGHANVSLTYMPPLSILSDSPQTILNVTIRGGGLAGQSDHISAGQREWSDDQFNLYPLGVRDGLVQLTLRGDFNLNDRIDIADVARVAYMAAGLTPVIPYADFNADGIVDISDASKIAWYYVGKIAQL